MNSDLNSSNLAQGGLSSDLTLADISIGRSALILELRGTDFIQESLSRIGIVTGALISIARQGDPAIVCLGSCRIGLSQELLRAVLVELEGE